MGLAKLIELANKEYRKIEIPLQQHLNKLQTDPSIL